MVSVRRWIIGVMAILALLAVSINARAEDSHLDECGGRTVDMEGQPYDIRTERHEHPGSFSYEIVDRNLYDSCKDRIDLRWDEPGDGVDAVDGRDTHDGLPRVIAERFPWNVVFRFEDHEFMCTRGLKGQRIVMQTIAAGAELKITTVEVKEPSDAKTSYVKVEVNGQVLALDPPAFVENGRTLVPMRSIFESLGATVSWDDATKTVTGRRGSTDVKLAIGSTMALINDTEVSLDVPAKIVDGRTFVPVRFVAEALGAKVTWNQATQMVIITDNQ